MFRYIKNMHPLLLLGIAWLVLISIDIPWLWFRMNYHSQLFASVQGSPLQIRYGPAALVYILFAMALLGYALPAESWQEAAKRGAIVGGVMYGFYDATNWATLRGWTAEMAIIDTVWGAVAGAIGSAALFYIQKKLK
jgi:uncharacterized membrane protein